jgi:hypothetical protein
MRSRQHLAQGGHHRRCSETVCCWGASLEKNIALGDRQAPDTHPDQTPILDADACQKEPSRLHKQFVLNSMVSDVQTGSVKMSKYISVATVASYKGDHDSTVRRVAF